MRWLVSFLVFTLFFGLYFIQLPLSGSLPGKVDSWFYVATFEYLMAVVKAYGIGLEFGNSLYPESSHLPFGNFSPGLAAIYGFFRVLGLDIIWSFWALLSITFAGNAIGASALFHSLRIRFWSSICAGLLVACNNYTIANIDNIDALFWTPGLLSVASVIRFDRGGGSSLQKASLLLGSQMLFSSYLFLLSGILWIPYIVKWTFQVVARVFEHNWTVLITPFPVVAIFMSPFVYLYFVEGGLTDSFNPAAMDGVGAFTGLHLSDLISYLPSTIYSNIFIEVGDNWYEKTHCAGLGLLLPMLGLLGLLRMKSRFLWLGLFVFFLLVAIGPILYVQGREFQTPMFWVSQLIEFNRFFRINIRALLAVILFLGLGFAVVLNKSKFAGVVVALTLTALIENIPFRHRKYSSSRIIEHTSSAEDIIGFTSDDVVLHLPSSFYTSLHPSFGHIDLKCVDAETEVIREYSYMLFQAMTGAKVVNGFTGFIPKSRIENQIKIFKLDDESCRTALLAENEICYVLLHLDWMKTGCDWGSEDYFRDAFKECDIVMSTDRFILLKINSIESTQNQESGKVLRNLRAKGDICR